MKLNAIILIFSCLVIIAISIPLILEKVRPNVVYGFRTQKTLSNEIVWYKANKFLGYSLGIAGFVSLTSLLLKEFYPSITPLSENPYFGIIIISFSIFIAIILSFFYLSTL